MANYDDGAYDDELADDWEAALEAEEQAEAEAAAAEAARLAAKAEKKQRRRVDDGDEDEDGVTLTDDAAAAASNLQAQAQDGAAAADAFGSAPTKMLAQWKVESEDECRDFGKAVGSELRRHHGNQYYHNAFPSLFRIAADKLTIDDLNDLLSKVNVAANEHKKNAAKKASEKASTVSRTRNVGLDGFDVADGVDDRGGAAMTEYEDFM